MCDGWMAAKGNTCTNSSAPPVMVKLSPPTNARQLATVYFKRAPPWMANPPPSSWYRLRTSTEPPSSTSRGPFKTSLSWWAPPPVTSTVPFKPPHSPTQVGWGVGSLEGWGVGVALGFAVCVGCEEGSMVGTGVGAWVGRWVGLGECPEVGDSVGAWLGVTVGGGVGTPVGAGVGPSEGAEVGGSEGARVGFWVSVELKASSSPQSSTSLRWDKPRRSEEPSMTYLPPLSLKVPPSAHDPSPSPPPPKVRRAES
mmetsp:Transcript_27850/g.57209  ORF Transcript_27850/g.57209 Transcript_27850/m.57209 type:complete len:254 (-) Transcript_27850:75-836(-)